MITDTEIETFVSTTHEALSQFREKLLQDQVAPLVGKTVKIERDLKDPASGLRSFQVLEATIVGAEWTYEDGIEFKVTYVHPFTGKVKETKTGA